MKNRNIYKFIAIIIMQLLLCGGCALSGEKATESGQKSGGDFINNKEDILDVIPEFSGEAFVELNQNIPNFTSDEKKQRESFAQYSDMDVLGRCKTAYANIGEDIMPTEERGAIGQIKPAGWHLVKYDIVEGNYLYNRCHLIGYQLAGENANEMNLITGTRYLNVVGMMPFENEVADYILKSNNHVLYRVTPIYKGDELLCRGVEMEAYSIEDEGQGICFHVFAYNCQPGIEIDYATGESRLKADDVIENQGGDVTDTSESREYILNTNTGKFHIPTCSSVNDMKDKNKKIVYGNREDMIGEGYAPCKNCNP